jgi:hypothetical protein
MQALNLFPNDALMNSYYNALLSSDSGSINNLFTNLGLEQDKSLIDVNKIAQQPQEAKQQNVTIPEPVIQKVGNPQQSTGIEPAKENINIKPPIVVKQDEKKIEDPKITPLKVEEPKELEADKINEAEETQLSSNNFMNLDFNNIDLNTLDLDTIDFS